MSLDVTLRRKRFISYDEGKTYTEDREMVYSANITHNLGKMAREANLYEALWRPHMLKEGAENLPEGDHNAEYEFECAQTIKANEIIDLVEIGLKKLKDNPNYFKQFDSDNGWGVYEHFVPFVEKYLDALREFPDAIVEVDR